MKARVFFLAVVLIAVGLAVFAHFRSLSGERQSGPPSELARRPQTETTGTSTNLPRRQPRQY